MELIMLFAAALGLAAAYDWTIGERPLITHPVMIFGGIITVLEPLLNRRTGRASGICCGIVLLLALGSVAMMPGIAIRAAFGQSSQAWYASLMVLAVCTYLVKTSFSIRAMNMEAHAVSKYVQAGRLDDARKQVSYIVSRPTGELDEEGVLSATVECVGESVVDGVVSPLFYAAMAGLYGCLGYRAVNTADSRIGYRTERFLHFGMPAARLDDVLNYIPARIAVAETILAAWVLRMDVKSGIAVWKRDRKTTSSPNAGHTMALYAGILGVKLEKEGHYILGDDKERLTVAHVDAACRLMNATSLLHIALCIAAVCLLPLPFIVV